MLQRQSSITAFIYKDPKQSVTGNACSTPERKPVRNLQSESPKKYDKEVQVNDRNSIEGSVLQYNFQIKQLDKIAHLKNQLVFKN